MAGSGTRNTTGIGLSRSVEGVQLKLNDGLLPPKKVTLPLGYEKGNPTDVLFLEYDFHLEEKVIAWADAQRRLAEEALRLQAEQVSSNVEDFMQARGELDDLTDEDEEVISVMAKVNEERMGQDGASSMAQADSPHQQPQPAVAPTESAPASALSPNHAHPPERNMGPAKNPSPINPLLQSLGHGAILVPTQIIPSNKATREKPSVDAAASLNLADFENEQDPFENAELRTLNDMEELNKVLQGAGAASGPAPQRSAVKRAAVNHQTSPRQATLSSQAGHMLPASQNSAQYPNPVLNVTSHGAAGGVNHPSYPTYNAPANGERYQASYNSDGTVSFNAHGSNQVNGANIQNALTRTSNEVRRLDGTTFLPSVTGSSVAMLPAYPTVNSVPADNSRTRSSSVQYSNLLQNSAPTSSKGCASPCGRPVPAYNSPNGLVGQYSKPRGLDTPPPVYPLRPAKSVPDLSDAADRKVWLEYPTAHTPPPGQGNCSHRSATPPPSPTDPQFWGMSSSASGPECYSSSSSRLSPCPAVPRKRSPLPNKASLPDPYRTMSHEAQCLVDSITDMGFSRARVARAVDRLGQDDKQVVDHLVLVTRLSEKGFPADDAETALRVYPNKEDKAEQYLRLTHRFRELGFAEHTVKDVLVTCELDENKALDELMAAC